MLIVFRFYSGICELILGLTLMFSLLRQSIRTRWPQFYSITSYIVYIYALYTHMTDGIHFMCLVIYLKLNYYIISQNLFDK